ncbi:hypothetical protein TBK1r_78080 [Stieleria magnilauensis]|uniref:Uncharacterized protein n=1 Tax=Stieleria magnilauensis TaxID=2527963 RepID=A0ABX5Y3A6_9BACT|nr:hypothetical protein TBK1r_78080 [Planctomycetes bacterium TBK1r]
MPPHRVRRSTIQTESNSIQFNGTRNRVREKDYHHQKRRLAYHGSRDGYLARCVQDALLRRLANLVLAVC